MISCNKEYPLGSRENPIKLYFTPSADSGKILIESEKLKQFLEKTTGYYFKTAIPASYIAVVEAFGSKRADVAMITSFAYLLARKKYNVKARLRAIRDNNAFYHGQIIARVDSGINSLSDINGKSFAYTDPSSTSGYIFAASLLKKHSITPSKITFGMKHDSVVTMVYQKQADAGATFHTKKEGKPADARTLVQNQFPDVLEKVKIVALTEKIPNEPIVFRKDISDDIINKIVDAFVLFFNTKEGKSVMSNMYSIDGIIPIKDSDYDQLKESVNRINLNVESLVK